MTLIRELAHAVWIGSDHPFDLQEAYLDFRSPSVLGADGDVVELLISADARYKLWVNGRFVARGPARCYPHAQSVDRLDLGPYWRVGANILAVQIYQPGYSHFSYVYRGAAGLLACLIVNGEPRHVTDSSWIARRNLSFAALVPRVSIYGSGREVRNLKLDDGWHLPAYSADEWASARVVGPLESIPWATLIEREVPELVERDFAATLWASRLSTQEIADHNEPHWALRDAWQGGEPETFIEDDQGWIRPSLPKGTSATCLYDLGRDYTCQGWAEVSNASGNEQLSISYAEKMRDNDVVISNPHNYCRMQVTDTFRLRAGDQIAEPYAMRGGRYVMFHLSGEVGQDFAFRPHVRIAEYPLTVKPLVTGDPLLDEIVTICEATMRACLQDSFVDCVWRESSQWLGDALPQSLSLWAMADDYRPMRKVLLDCARGQYPDGSLPSVTPAEILAYTIPRYNCMWVELLDFYYQVTADKEFLERLWKHVDPLLQAMLRHRDRNGLIITPPGRRHYIDWSATSQSDPHCVYNLHVVLALQTATSLASRSGLAPGANWNDETGLLKEKARAVFWQDGRWYDDRSHSTFSQLAAAMALLAGAVEERETAGQLDAIVARSLDPDDGYSKGELVLASPFMHHYLFQALGKYRRWHSIIDIIRLRWGRWVKQGFPTTWENWNVDFPDGSQCHAYAAHPLYHLLRAIQEGKAAIIG